MSLRRLASVTIVVVGVLSLPAGATSSTQSNAIFSDTFSRTTGLGAAWLVPYGSFQTDGTYAISGTPPANGNWASLTGGVVSADYSVSADIIIPNGSLDSGVVARSSDPANFDSTLYSAQIATDGSLNLYRRNSWTWTQLASVQAGVQAGLTYNLKLFTTGDSPVHIEVWLNSVQKIVFDDSSTARVTTGNCGLENYNSGVKYTNFTMTAAPRRIFSDVFARTTGLGGNWQVLYGTFSTNGTAAVSGNPPTNGNWASVVPSLGTTDYTVSANMVVPAGAVTPGLVVRSSDASNFDSTLYAAQLSTQGSVNLYRRNGWNWTLLQSTALTVVANTAYSMAFSVSGSTPVHLDVDVGGARLISYDDNDAARVMSGIIGIENYDAGVQYSNFAVYPISTWPSGSDVVWTNQVNTSTSGATITKTGGTSGADDTGGVSQQSVPSGNAAFEHTVDDVNRTRAVGLGHSSTWNGTNGIDFGFKLGNGAANIYENGVSAGSVPVAVGDTLRIDVKSGTVRYYQNGCVVHKSTGVPRYPLRVMTSMSDAQSTIRGGKMWITEPAEVDVDVQGRVSVSLNGQGSGRVTSNPAGIDCPGACTMDADIGTVVTLTASPSPNSSFEEWNGACSGTASCTVSVTSCRQMTVFANFRGVPPPPASGPCGTQLCSSAQGIYPGGSWVPYSKTSAFNLPVQANAKILQGSAQMVARLLTGDHLGAQQNKIGNQIFPLNGITGWPTYWATCSDPAFTISCGSGCSVDAWNSVHAPAQALVQGNDPTQGDRHMTIIDQTRLVSSGSGGACGLSPTSAFAEIDLFRETLSPLPSNGSSPITGSWSGYSSLTGNGRAIPEDQPNGQGNDGRVGNLAGRVRIEEFKAAITAGGYLGHAIGIAVNCTDPRIPAKYPATAGKTGAACSDTTIGPGLTDDNAPPMGARLHLKMSIQDINNLGTTVPEWRKVILRTLSVYGAIIQDTGASGWFDMQTESDLQYNFNKPQGTAGPWYSWASSVNNNYDMAPNTYFGTGFLADWSPRDSNGANFDGVDWMNTVWNHLEFLDECSSKPSGC